MYPLTRSGVALITGAGSGMGQAMAPKFAEHGCRKLFLVDISNKGLQVTEALVEEAGFPAQVAIHVADVRIESAVKNMGKSCVKKYGRVDFSMNNAGVGEGGVKTADMSLEMFERDCETNEKGVYLCERYEIEQMLTQEPLPIFDDDRAVRGSIVTIVNTASVSGTSALPGLSGYNNSNHAVVIMTRVDARQSAPQKIRVNSVCPGYMPTPMMTSAGLSEETLNSIKTLSPMNRMTYPVGVAETVVFLSSSRASAITGVILAVDAGATLYHIV